MAEEAEKAAAEQRMGVLYQIIRNLCGKRRNTNMPVRDKHGKLIPSEQQLQERWNEHFEGYLIGQNQQRLLKYPKQKLTQKSTLKYHQK